MPSAVLTALRPLGLLGAALLVIAEFTPLFRIESGSETIATVGTGPHHGYALLVIGLSAGVLIWLAGGSRAGLLLPAAVTLLGVVAVLIFLTVDVPDLGADGAYGDIGREATAVAGPGFYLQSVGAILVLLAGACLLVSGWTRREVPEPAG